MEKIISQIISFIYCTLNTQLKYRQGCKSAFDFTSYSIIAKPGYFSGEKKAENQPSRPQEAFDEEKVFQP